jgi:riboflavin kinase/FMN adenylyltransferase
MENGHQECDSGAWVTIGSFDGVHLGHQAIINKLVKESHESHFPAIVVTFFPHPLKYLKRIKGAYYLTSPQEKDNILRGLGIDSVLTLLFDTPLREKSAQAFIRMLHSQLRFTHLIIGHNFKLGLDRGGDFHSLAELGKELGYCVQAIDQFKLSSQPVSSSVIRELIKSGDVAKAADMLGRHYRIEGQIQQKGFVGQAGLSKLTLSVWEDKLLPKAGIYAAFTDIKGQRYPCVVQISPPSASPNAAGQQTIQAYISDLPREFKGENLGLSLAKQLHAEKVFDSHEEMMVQINKDIQLSREVLAHESRKTNLSA